MEDHSYSSVESGTEKKKLGSILKLDKLTYEDFHPQVVLKQMDNPLPKPKGSRRKHVERNCSNSEELVRYMSNLPCYLERGECPQEKAFSVGVLDWRVLEKWQKHNYNTDFNQTNVKNSHSRNYSSSFISPGGPSSHCSRGHSWSPQRQEMNQSHVNVPGSEGCCSSSTSSFSRDSESFQNCNSGLVNPANFVQGMSMETQSSTGEMAECKDKDPGRRRRPKIRPHIESGGITVNRGSKGKEVNHKAESVSRQQDLQVPSYATVSVLFERRKTEDDCQGTAGNRCQSGSSQGNNHISSEEADRFGRGSSATDSPSDYSQAKELLSEEEHITSRGNVTESASIRKNVEMKSSSSLPRKLAEQEIPQSKMGIEESTKVGSNSSVNRRFSFGLGRMGKKNVASSMKFSVSEEAPDTRITSTSGDSTCEKPSATSKSRSSPLKRLLDPLLKPKNFESSHLAKSLDLDPSTTAKSLNSTCKLGEAPLQVMLDSQRDKNGSARVQALLQVAVKNGLPLFTFTVLNCSDIFVATVKESGLPKQADHGRVYTFFSIREMQKKNASWMSKGSKERNQTYVSNVVAQMRVSAVKSSAREFVLTSMGTESVPNDEMAAAIVEFPENCSKSEDDNFNAKIILPGGDHGVPRKGDPSSLIERWRSGGSCDCGGWDLGCRIRTLANNHQSCQRLDSAKPESTAFKLFSQDEADGNSKPLFILSPFKEGIFSVEFHSSIQLTQAFSIGIAILNSRRMDDVSVGSNISEDVASESCNVTNQAAFEASADVWIPPLSPFGRV